MKEELEVELDRGLDFKLQQNYEETRQLDK